MKTRTFFALGIAAWALAGVSANKPEFVLPETIFAAPGLECNIYFETSLDSVRPDLYAYEAVSKVGRCENTRWTWTPKPEDAGRRENLVLSAWSDFQGCVAAMTVTVQVASAPTDTSRRITLALLGDSLTSSRFQDRLRDDMVQAGWTNYVPIGSHAGGSSIIGFEPGAAAHDGYGGFTPLAFLTRYAVAIDEIDCMNNRAEAEMLRKFGEKIPPGREWQKGLMKSPLVKIVRGQKVLDVQGWLNRINDGKAPDFIVIELGVNGTCAMRENQLAEGMLEQSQVAPMRTLIAELRKCAPKAEIVLGTCSVGSADQDAFGANYGCAISRVSSRKAVFALSRLWMKLVRDLNAAGDSRVYVTAMGSALDAVHAYPHASVQAFSGTKKTVERATNAYHPVTEGGRQMGDAFAAWLLNRLSAYE